MPPCWRRTLPPRTPLLKSYYCVLRIAQIRSCASSEASRSDGRRLLRGLRSNSGCPSLVAGELRNLRAHSRRPDEGFFLIDQSAAGLFRKPLTSLGISF